MSNYHAVIAARAAAKLTTNLLRDLAVANGNARSSGYERQPQEWYVESRHAIDALLDVEKFSKIIWDPACGGGNIPKACADRGYSVVGTDITYREYGYGDTDFLTETSLKPKGAFSVVVNPPFSLAVDFTLRSFTLGATKTAILQRTTWLEGERRYKQLFSLNKLKNIWQFRSRVSMPPGGVDVEAKNGSVAYAWYVFDKAHDGLPTLGWLP